MQMKRNSKSQMEKEIPITNGFFFETKNKFQTPNGPKTKFKRR